MAKQRRRLWRLRRRWDERGVAIRIAKLLHTQWYKMEQDQEFSLDKSFHNTPELQPDASDTAAIDPLPLSSDTLSSTLPSTAQFEIQQTNEEMEEDPLIDKQLLASAEEQLAPTLVSSSPIVAPSPSSPSPPPLVQSDSPFTLSPTLTPGTPVEDNTAVPVRQFPLSPLPLDDPLPPEHDYIPPSDLPLPPLPSLFSPSATAAAGAVQAAVEASYLIPSQEVANVKDLDITNPSHRHLVRTIYQLLYSSHTLLSNISSMPADTLSPLLSLLHRTPLPESMDQLSTFPLHAIHTLSPHSETLSSLQSMIIHLFALIKLPPTAQAKLYPKWIQGEMRQLWQRVYDVLPDTRATRTFPFESIPEPDPDAPIPADIDDIIVHEVDEARRRGGGLYGEYLGQKVAQLKSKNALSSSASSSTNALVPPLDFHFDPPTQTKSGVRALSKSASKLSNKPTSKSTSKPSSTVISPSSSKPGSTAVSRSVSKQKLNVNVNVQSRETSKPVSRSTSHTPSRLASASPSRTVSRSASTKGFSPPATTSSISKTRPTSSSAAAIGKEKKSDSSGSKENSSPTRTRSISPSPSSSTTTLSAPRLNRSAALRKAALEANNAKKEIAENKLKRYRKHTGVDPDAPLSSSTPSSSTADTKPRTFLQRSRNLELSRLDEGSKKKKKSASEGNSSSSSSKKKSSSTVKPSESDKENDSSYPAFVKKPFNVEMQSNTEQEDDEKKKKEEEKEEKSSTEVKKKKKVVKKKSITKSATSPPPLSPLHRSTSNTSTGSIHTHALSPPRIMRSNSGGNTRSHSASPTPGLSRAASRSSLPPSNETAQLLRELQLSLTANTLEIKESLIMQENRWRKEMKDALSQIQSPRTTLSSSPPPSSRPAPTPADAHDELDEILFGKGDKQIVEEEKEQEQQTETALPSTDNAPADSASDLFSPASSDINTLEWDRALHIALTRGKQVIPATPGSKGSTIGGGQTLSRAPSSTELPVSAAGLVAASPVPENIEVVSIERERKQHAR